MSNNTRTDKEFILEQKLYIIIQLIYLIKDQNILSVKNISKENKDIQTKLLNMRTEILKIEDKLNDILNINKVNSVNEINKTVAQFLNLINEEKAANISVENQNQHDIKNNDNNVNKSEQKTNNVIKLHTNNTDLEEMKIRTSFNEMIARENKDVYESIKDDEEYKEFLDCSDFIVDEEDSLYQDYLDDRYEEYKKYYKEFYALVNSANIKSWNTNDFDKYMRLRDAGSVKITFCDDKNGNLRIYSKYDLLGLIKENPYDKQNISKRQLPTEIFKYLISNNIIKESDFKIFSKNQFGRTFESKMGDILNENELPEEIGRQKRYNKIDFSEFEHSKFKSILYISNQWSEDSIVKFIAYIRENYNDYIMIIDPHKQLLEEMISNPIPGTEIHAQHLTYEDLK